MVSSALVAVVLSLAALWRPRCPRCKVATVIDDAPGDVSSAIVMLVYRCPRCRAVAHRRFVGAWD